MINFTVEQVSRPNQRSEIKMTPGWLVVATLAVYLSSVTSANLPLNDGDVCISDGGVEWHCKAPNKCPGHTANRSRDQQCASTAVCCKPIGIKSDQMCKKYGEYVYTLLPDPLGEGYEKYDNCAATVEPLITNGQNAEAREYPHMALIGFGEKNSIRWLCGGSLISERFVLSAAHCSVGARWVRLGEYNMNTTEDEDQGLSNMKEYEIAERIKHPQYQSDLRYYDIVLFRLTSDVQFNEYIRPLCLHTKDEFPNTYGIATGWGTTKWKGNSSDVLQKVNVTITPKDICINSYKTTTKLTRGIEYKSMICAGDTENRQDTCQGDSGGPLQVRLADPYCMYSIIGITSFGFQCARNKPAVYTRVSHYIPWIESVVWP